MVDIVAEARDSNLLKPEARAPAQPIRPNLTDRGKFRVFISYSRDDREFADQLLAALETCGFECIIDREDIAGGQDWKQRLGALIAEADSVIFVLSRASARSDICAWEVDESARLGKRILPVAGKSLGGASLPPRLRPLQRIFFYPEPDQDRSGFGVGLERLVNALNTDFDWLREHTRYLQRASEWDKRGRPANRLLFGEDIAEANAWADGRPTNAPEPTPLQLDFIRASEQEAEARLSAEGRQLERTDAILLSATSIIVSLQDQLDDDTRRQVFVLFQSGAELDAPYAMRNLGVLYVNGWGVAQDYAKAREWYEKAADKGDADAMRNLGVLYANGWGVAQDDAKAREWYEKATETGDASAMNKLGALYANGQGVAQDYGKAREWYEKAADKGDATAMRNIGVLYANGQGVAQDYAKAYVWYKMAVNRGDATAMRNLGVLYANGQGIAQDYGRAREWYEKAADKGDATAMRNLGVLYAHGQVVAQDYGRAREWYEMAADKGDATAMRNLGVLYANGQGVAQDYGAARAWYEKAANKGDAGGMNNLGALYDNGQGIAQDYGKAREWYEKAADKGDAGGMNNLGALYDNGQGVAQDYGKAREWYEKAADKGSAIAMRNLGVLYANGHGVAQDYAKAGEWYEKAADKGEPIAMLNLGSLYVNGQGVAQDYGLAREWYERAADKGDATAMFNLGALYAHGQGVPQDYGKACEWYEKAADKGDATAMVSLGALHLNGWGMAQDYGKAREWYHKAANKGDADAMMQLEILAIREAAETGRYADALRLAEALAVKTEAQETGRGGTPGRETALRLHLVAWQALFAREFGPALTAAERAHALLPAYLLIETNRAHALMFIGRGEEAQSLYLAYKGKRISAEDQRPWERAIADDFAEFLKAGLRHPMIGDIERKLGVSN